MEEKIPSCFTYAFSSNGVGYLHRPDLCVSGSLNFISAVLVLYQVWANKNPITTDYSFGLSISLTAALSELGWDSGRNCLHSPANPL